MTNKGQTSKYPGRYSPPSNKPVKKADFIDDAGKDWWLKKGETLDALKKRAGVKK